MVRQTNENNEKIAHNPMNTMNWKYLVDRISSESKDMSVIGFSQSSIFMSGTSDILTISSLVIGITSLLLSLYVYYRLNKLMALF